MTYCLAIRTRSGIVGIADTRITSGRETTKARKLYLHNRDKHSLFIMTSGLRSVRDKALTYFKEAIAERDESFNKLYKAVNAFGEQVKRVADEDKGSIENAGWWVGSWKTIMTINFLCCIPRATGLRWG